MDDITPSDVDPIELVKPGGMANGGVDGNGVDVEMQPDIGKSLMLFFVTFVIIAVGLLLYRFIIYPLQTRRRNRQHLRDQQAMAESRNRQLHFIEAKCEEFKKTEEFNKLEKDAEDREQCIRPINRRTVNRCDDDDGFDNSRSLGRRLGGDGTNYRPNPNTRYKRKGG